MKFDWMWILHELELILTLKEYISELLKKSKLT